MRIVAAWDGQVLADNVNDALVIRVTGSAAAPVHWVATVRTTEVLFSRPARPLWVRRGVS